MDKNIGIIYLQVLVEAMRLRTCDETRKLRKKHEKNQYLTVEQKKRNYPW